ncbi:unnamed protein product, partial [Polarella glacialis]
VCPMEGTIRFATVDQSCKPGDPKTAICYENSQGWDCPQGFGCGTATTDFTQYDNFCEAGFWCKVRTIPSETRNLVCPAGYYCKRETGESGGSGRKAFRCPSNHVCPEGTAAADVRVDNQLVIVLHNVQSKIEVVTKPDLTRGSMCRICPETVPAGQFDLSQCLPCGQIPIVYDLVAASRRLKDVNDDGVDYRGAADHEPYSATDPGLQVFVLPADFVEELVDLGPTAWDEQAARTPVAQEPRKLASELPYKDFRRALAAVLAPKRQHPAVLAMAELLANRSLPPPVVGTYYVEETKETFGDDEKVKFAFDEAANFTYPINLDGARVLQEIATNSSNSSNGTNSSGPILQCAPDVTTSALTPWSAGLPCYTAVDDWKGNLKCPRGTISTIGSKGPQDCIQQGELIAMQNVYRCFPPRPCAEGLFEPDFKCSPEE